MKEKSQLEYSRICPECNAKIVLKNKNSWWANRNSKKSCRRCVIGYSLEEEKFLIDNYSKLGRKECSRQLNRTEFSIGVKTSKLRLVMTPQPKDPINNKICVRCDLELSKDRFGVTNRNKDKHSNMCKSCSQYDRRRSDKLENKRKYDAIYKTKKKTCPIFKLRKIVKKRITRAMKLKSIKKRHSIIKLLGCSIIDLQQHLKSQFKYGMSWDNHGFKGWHIDHIIPLSSAKTQEEMERLCHYTNLQPLWWYENLSKKDKIL